MSKPIHIGINAFGRIGAQLARQLSENPNIQVAHVNDISIDPNDPSDVKYDLAYDSAHGRLDVEVVGDKVKVGDEEFGFSDEKDPRKIPWKEHHVDLVVDCTPFSDREFLSKHLASGVGHVIKSSPADADFTAVFGVNMEAMNIDTHRLISNASCTTNCAAPVLKTIMDAFGIESGHLQSTHSATSNNRTVDGANRSKPERGRSVLDNIIPTSTGAAKAIPKVLPELDGKLTADATRVPVLDGSLLTFNLVLGEDTTADDINAVLEKAAQGPLKNVIACSDEELTCHDIRGRHEAAVVLTHNTRVSGRLATIHAFYDNEAGYVAQLVRTIQALGHQAGYDVAPNPQRAAAAAQFSA